MWNVVAMLMTLALAMGGGPHNGPFYGSTPEPVACFEDGRVKLGSSCDTVRMVQECVEKVINSDGVAEGNPPDGVPDLGPAAEPRGVDLQLPPACAIIVSPLIP